MPILILDVPIQESPSIPLTVFLWVFGGCCAIIWYLYKQAFNRAQTRADADSKRIVQINNNMILLMERTKKIDKIEADVEGLKRWQGVVNERFRIPKDDESNNS